MSISGLWGNRSFQSVVRASKPNFGLWWPGCLLTPGLLPDEYALLIESLGPDRVRSIHLNRFTRSLPPSSTAAGTVVCARASRR